MFPETLVPPPRPGVEAAARDRAGRRELRQAVGPPRAHCHDWPHDAARGAAENHPGQFYCDEAESAISA